VRRAASWVRTGGSVLFLTTTRYPSSHVEQVADLVEHEVPGVRERFTAAGVASLAEVQARLVDLPRDGLLVVIDGASDLLAKGLEDLRRAGIKTGLSTMLPLTFDLARSVEAKGYHVVVTLGGE
jgi:hypothetical protein